MNLILLLLVILHLIVGFAYFIWKLEFQGKKSKNDEGKTN